MAAKDHQDDTPDPDERLQFTRTPPGVSVGKAAGVPVPAKIGQTQTGGGAVGVTEPARVPEAVATAKAEVPLPVAPPQPVIPRIITPYATYEDFEGSGAQQAVSEVMDDQAAEVAEAAGQTQEAASAVVEEAMAAALQDVKTGDSIEFPFPFLLLFRS